MTELMLRNINLVKEEKDVPIDNQCLIDWMDDKVDALDMIGQIVHATDHDCNMGHLDAVFGEYEIRVETCRWSDVAKREVFVYRGIRHLANAVGAELNVAPYGVKDWFKAAFMYRNVEFYQLRKKTEKEFL